MGQKGPAGWRGRGRYEVKVYTSFWLHRSWHFVFCATKNMCQEDSVQHTGFMNFCVAHLCNENFRSLHKSCFFDIKSWFQVETQKSTYEDSSHVEGAQRILKMRSGKKFLWGENFFKKPYEFFFFAQKNFCATKTFVLHKSCSLHRSFLTFVQGQLLCNTKL